MARAINRYVHGSIELQSIQEAIDFVEDKFKHQKVIFLRGRGELLKFGNSPCYSPWFNGIAESMVKVFKSHLVKVVQSGALNYREMYSVVKRLEAMINSRPFAVYNPENGSAGYVITPSHFWACRPLVALPSSGTESLCSQPLKLTRRVALMDEMLEKLQEIVREKHFEEIKGRPKWRIVGLRH